MGKLRLRLRWSMAKKKSHLGLFISEMLSLPVIFPLFYFSYQNSKTPPAQSHGSTNVRTRNSTPAFEPKERRLSFVCPHL